MILLHRFIEICQTLGFLIFLDTRNIGGVDDFLKSLLLFHPSFLISQKFFLGNPDYDENSLYNGNQKLYYSLNKYPQIMGNIGLIGLLHLSFYIFLILQFFY